VIDRKLSLAIQIGQQQTPPADVAAVCGDVLGTAFLGSLYNDTVDLPKFYRLCATASNESIWTFITRGLQRKFPNANRRVSSLDSHWFGRRGTVDMCHRVCPQLVRIGRGGTPLDPTIFGLVVGMEERLHWPMSDIAQFLGKQGM
jgi:hypothetical protein